MNILIKDEQGLGFVLMMEKYSQAQIQAAKQTIRKQFRDTAKMVFSEVLDKPLPETLVVDLSQNTNEELKGDKNPLLAYFNSELSQTDHLIFSVREITVKIALAHGDDEKVRATVIHEMLHAADQPVLGRTSILLNDLQNDIYARADDFFTKDEAEAFVALLSTLQLFNHYRAEGIAILGEHLLTKRPMKVVADTVTWFRKIYERTLLLSKTKASGGKVSGKIFDNTTFESAYIVAPSILLLVLTRRGEVAKELATRALEGLNNGTFDLTEDETKTIIKAAMSLSLSDYVQGVVSLGDGVAPAKPFLEFCILLNDENWGEDDVEAFISLLRQPKTVESFNEALEQIMGYTMKEDAIDAHYKAFIEDTSIEAISPGIKEKVARLYDELKNGSDPDKKRTVKWALTYLFEDNDIICDGIKGIGYVDDMAVVDYAFDIISS